MLSRTGPNQCQDWILQMRSHLSCKAISFGVTISQAGDASFKGYIHRELKTWMDAKFTEI